MQYFVVKLKHRRVLMKFNGKGLRHYLNPNGTWAPSPITDAAVCIDKVPVKQIISENLINFYKAIL